MSVAESVGSSGGFYRDLVPFSDFGEITEDRHFQSVPQDWCVVITDVKGSTRAIEAGQYKDVNTIGAASIAAVQNTLRGLEFPFVFGGDGATLLIQQSCRELVSRKLGSLKVMSMQNFGLELRVGIVDVSEIVNERIAIEVAKFELVPGNCVAILRGGGLTVAERLVKGSPDRFEIPESDSAGVDLGGLSCRWSNIPSNSGCMLSMLVAASEKCADPKQVYLDLLEEMRALFASPIAAANPVDLSSMSYRSVTECIENEKRFHAGISLAWVLRYLEIVATNLLFKSKPVRRWLAPKPYLNAMSQHSDYRKFDDMLRMIIDCSPAQADKLGEYLERAHQRGELNYGLHRSESALMTCYVHSLRDGDHIHFIDGGDGGYAMAAKQLKAQMKE